MFDNNDSDYLMVIFVYRKFLFPGNRPKYGYFEPEIDIFEIYLKTDRYIFLKICMMFDNNDSYHLTVISIYKKKLFPRKGPKYSLHLELEIDVIELTMKFSMCPLVPESLFVP